MTDPTCRNSPIVCLHRHSRQTTPAQNTGHALVLYSGPGGSSLGLRQAGTHTLGVDNDPDAVATATKADLFTIQADVTDLDPGTFHRDTLAGSPGPFILQASPPCPGFSKAGAGTGRKDLPALLDAMDELAATPVHLREEVALARRIFLDAECVDPRSALTMDPIRWVAGLMPDHIMLEQTREVLPVWAAYRTTLRAWGYSAWAGLVHSEQYEVPQTRTRAFLLASRHGPTYPPTPTASRYNNRAPWRTSPGLGPWVTMADALGWGTDREAVGLRLQTSTIDGHPRVNNQSGSAFDYAWPADRPAPAIAGRGLAPMPGANANRFNGRTKSRNDGIRISVAEAGVLQTFPPDYPWQGTRHSQYRQIGNAVPPRLQATLTTELLRRARR